ALARETSISLADLAGAGVEVPAGGSRPLIHPRPSDGLEARFSAPYAVIACLADGSYDLRSLHDAAVCRPELQACLPLVALQERDGPVLGGSEIESAPVTVTLRLKNGTVVSRTQEVTPGSSRDPVTDSQLLLKWIDCFAVAGTVAN